MKNFVITGTDTDIGKTIFSAALMLALEEADCIPYYWKPIQSGIAEDVDTRTVQKLTNLPDERFLPEAYILSSPLSPHRAAEIDEVEIDISVLREKSRICSCSGAVVIEGAGGLMVPLTRRNLQVNLYRDWGIPVILCSRTGLGTINHTLLSIEAIQMRKIRLLGVVFIGEDNEDNIKTIADFSGVKVLGRLPIMERLDDESLRMNFRNHFNIKDFIL